MTTEMYLDSLGLLTPEIFTVVASWRSSL